jgi:hypothetical protein
MTEEAESALRLLASVRTGGVHVSFHKDTETGAYSDSYRSVSCPNPKATPEELRRFQQHSEERLLLELRTLKSLADLDASGFVSTEEARRFVDLWMFGVKLVEVMKFEGRSRQGVARAMRMSVDALDRQMAAYGEFRSSLAFPDDGPPPLP